LATTSGPMPRGSPRVMASVGRETSDMRIRTA
jgi:hypothetical protein